MNPDRKVIFLVDDDITNLTIGSNVLSELYSVVTLNSGERLLKMLEKKIPDLILLDIDMPEMNGYQAIQQIKSVDEFKDIPVIFLTAKNDSGSELEGLSLGAVDYIIKPFSPPLLLKRIEIYMLIESQKKEIMEQSWKLVRFSTGLQEMVNEKTKAVVELKNAILKAIADLVEFRDDTTGSHTDRTQGYLRVLVEALIESGMYREEVSSWDVESVVQAAQLHDLGKIGVDDNILRKPGKLTPEEFEAMKLHTTYSEKILDKIKKNTSQHDFLEQARIFASTHHEKWDGSGYPRGLVGKEIPLQGRLMAIADVYDALVSKRPYKNAYSHEEAVRIIEDSGGSHFDPALLQLFLGVSDKFNEIAVLHKS